MLNFRRRKSSRRRWSRSSNGNVQGTDEPSHSTSTSSESINTSALPDVTSTQSDNTSTQSASTVGEAFEAPAAIVIPGFSETPKTTKASSFDEPGEGFNEVNGDNADPPKEFTEQLPDKDNLNVNGGNDGGDVSELKEVTQAEIPEEDDLNVDGGG